MAHLTYITVNTVAKYSFLVNIALLFHFKMVFAGYIIEISGPYMGANSDSQITKKIIQDARRAAENFASWLDRDDILIVDRGFFDCVDVLQDMGFQVR